MNNKTNGKRSKTRRGRKRDRDDLEANLDWTRQVSNGTIVMDKTWRYIQALEIYVKKTVVVAQFVQSSSCYLPFKFFNT